MKYNNIILLSVILFIFSCDQKDEIQGTLPPNVTVYETVQSDVPIYQEYIGETIGYKDIDIAARVQGYLEGIHFDEGSIVKEGDLLYNIERQQYEANVAEKQSKLAEQQTLLANAKSDLGRYEPLVRENAISEIEYDSAKSRYEAAISSVEAAQANLDAAEIQLGYSNIYSPIDGIIGITKAKVGDFVGSSPGNSILNTVSSVDPILVQFFVTESQYLYFARKYGTDPREHEHESNLQLILADNSIYQFKGKFDFLDRSVDTQTGAIIVQVSFPNPNKLLRPGQFAKVRAEIDLVENAILIPQRCVSELQGIFSVFVVDENNKVSSRQVKAGETVGQFWLIRSGLGPGEKVVYEGLQTVREGAIVNPAVEEIPIPELKEN